MMHSSPCLCASELQPRGRAASNHQILEPTKTSLILWPRTATSKARDFSDSHRRRCHHQPPPHPKSTPSAFPFMVSCHPGAAEGGGSRREVASSSSSVVFFPPDLPGSAPMALPGTSPGAEEDHSKKIRKPYTITKSRESWTEQEHDKFLEALQLFDRDWKKIEAFVGTKTVIQIRSHAQKYFLKAQKNGTNEHVPPPRPKRKAAHPYPQKAPKNAQQTPFGTVPLQGSCLLEPGYALAMDTSSTPKKSATSVPMLPKVQSSMLPVSGSHSTTDDTGPAGVSAANKCSSGTIGPTAWPNSEAADLENHATALHVMPDFAQVYCFLGSVFDPSDTGHLEKLKEMDPIDVETVLLLMRNLAINLISPDFETHIRLLSSYNGGAEDVKPGTGNNMLKAGAASFMLKGE